MLGWGVSGQVFRYVRKGACFLSEPKDKHGCGSVNSKSHLFDFWLSSWGNTRTGKLRFQISSFLLCERALFCWWWKNIIGPTMCLYCHASAEMCYVCGQKHASWRCHETCAGSLKSLRTIQRGGLNGSVRVLLPEEHSPQTSPGSFSRDPKHYGCWQRHTNGRQQRNLKLHKADPKSTKQ